jgi:hypothetical protein
MDTTTTLRITKLGLRGLIATGAALVVLLALGATQSSAATATPCWKLVLNDWLVDGRIDKVYPSHCYGEAQKHLGEDAKVYSSLPADLRRGLLASLAQGKKQAQQQEADGQTGTNPSGAGAPPGGSDGNGPSNPSGGSGGDKAGFLTRAIRAIGPSDATSIPTPLLVLGGLAILLLLAALASWLARRYQSRRLRPAPATPPPSPKRP